jgi:hypothetical protein
MEAGVQPYTPADISPRNEPAVAIIGGLVEVQSRFGILVTRKIPASAKNWTPIFRSCSPQPNIYTNFTMPPIQRR